MLPWFTLFSDIHEVSEDVGDSVLFLNLLQWMSNMFKHDATE